MAPFNDNAISICENVITENEAQIGGAVYLGNKSEARVERNLVYCNVAVQHFVMPDPPPVPLPAIPLSFAGGVYVTDADVEVRHNTIYNNTGFDPRVIGELEQSGGIHGQSLAAGDPHFYDNILLANDGWEFYTNLSLFECPVDHNVGYDPMDPMNIFHPDAFPGPAFGCTPFEWNLIADPLLTDATCPPLPPEPWDPWDWSPWAPLPGSPAIDWASDRTDVGAVIDSGFVPGTCLPQTPEDCNANGLPDRYDLLSCTSTDLDRDGVADDCGMLGTPFCSGDGRGENCPCDNWGACGEGCANSTGAGGVLYATGSASVAADDLMFHATQLVPLQPAWLIFGNQAMNGGEGIVFGDGLQCVGPFVSRSAFAIPDAKGRASWGPGLLGSSGGAAGNERHYQVWYRDPAGAPCGTGSNFTNAVTILLEP